MKRFLLKTLIFLFLFFILDKALIFWRNYSPEFEVDKRLEEIITGRIKADILIFGSSRGARNICANQMQNSLKCKVYNLSYPGSNVEFHEYLLNQLLEHNNKIPKNIILVIDDPYELVKNKSLTFRYDRLYPLVKYKCIRNTLIEKKEKNKILSQLFVIHQLNKCNFRIRKVKCDELSTIHECGSMPITFQDPRFDHIYSNEVRIYNRDEEDINYCKSLTNIINTCASNKINLILACPPNFYIPTKNFYNRVVELSENKAFVHTFNISKPEYIDASYYYNIGHLKLNGANIYTSEITEYIQTKELLSGYKEKAKEE